MNKIYSYDVTGEVSVRGKKKHYKSVDRSRCYKSPESEWKKRHCDRCKQVKERVKEREREREQEDRHNLSRVSIWPKVYFVCHWCTPHPQVRDIATGYTADAINWFMGLVLYCDMALSSPFYLSEIQHWLIEWGRKRETKDEQSATNGLVIDLTDVWWELIDFASPTTRYFSSPLDPCDSPQSLRHYHTKQQSLVTPTFFVSSPSPSPILLLLHPHVSRLLHVFSCVNETHCKYIHASLDRTKSSEEESSGDFMKIITDDSVSSRRQGCSK